MSGRLAALIERARGVKMTPEQLTAQEIDFAWGNVALEHPEITREQVALASKWTAKGFPLPAQPDPVGGGFGTRG